jgi:hypothetical protein
MARKRHGKIEPRADVNAGQKSDSSRGVSTWQIDEGTSLSSSWPRDGHGAADSARRPPPGWPAVHCQRSVCYRMRLAAAANRYDAAMIDEPINQRRRHHVVAEDSVALSTPHSFQVARQFLA